MYGQYSRAGYTGARTVFNICTLKYAEQFLIWINKRDKQDVALAFRQIVDAPESTFKKVLHKLCVL